MDIFLASQPFLAITFSLIIRIYLFIKIFGVTIF